MENDVLDALEDLGYTGPLSDHVGLMGSAEEGPTSVAFTQLVEWLVHHIAELTGVEERVHAISCPDDSASFLLEVSGFFREYVQIMFKPTYSQEGCVYPDLTEGPVGDRLNSAKKCLQLLDFLSSELQAVRMIAKKRPTTLRPPGTPGSAVAANESDVAVYMKKMLVGLGFLRPPDSITSFTLFSKLEAKIKELMGQYQGQVDKPLLKARLSEKQWDNVLEVNEAMSQEYRIRRDMLLKRLEVTIQSFRWSDKAKRNENKINELYDPVRKELQTKTSIGVPEILAAREDLTHIQKTSSGDSRKECKINKILIGRVPDRGGRAWELEPPPPEMPSFHEAGQRPRPETRWRWRLQRWPRRGW